MRVVHSALRRSAAEAASGTGCAPLGVEQHHQRRQRENRDEKEKSLRTIGPMIAISRLDDGITPLSDNSCSPATTSCAATRTRIAVVTRKNFCRLMRTLPLTNITPNATAAITPASVPRKLISSVEFNDTAERISTVSAPSRSTMRNTKKNSPIQASLPASKPDLAFNFALQFPARPHHENHHGDDEEGGDQHDPAFENVFIPVQPGDQDGDPNASQKRGRQRRINGLAQVIAADLAQISQRDADDQGRLHPFAQRNYESLEHFQRPTKLKMNFNFNFKDMLAAAAQSIRSVTSVRDLHHTGIYGIKRMRASPNNPGNRTAQS